MDFACLGVRGVPIEDGVSGDGGQHKRPPGHPPGRRRVSGIGFVLGRFGPRHLMRGRPHGARDGYFGSHPGPNDVRIFPGLSERREQDAPAGIPQRR